MRAKLGSLLTEHHGYELIQCCNEDASLERLQTLFHTEIASRVHAGTQLVVYL